MEHLAVSHIEKPQIFFGQRQFGARGGAPGIKLPRQRDVGNDPADKVLHGGHRVGQQHRRPVPRKIVMFGLIRIKFCRKCVLGSRPVVDGTTDFGKLAGDPLIQGRCKLRFRDDGRRLLDQLARRVQCGCVVAVQIVDRGAGHRQEIDDRPGLTLRKRSVVNIAEVAFHFGKPGLDVAEHLAKSKLLVLNGLGAAPVQGCHFFQQLVAGRSRRLGLILGTCRGSGKQYGRATFQLVGLGCEGLGIRNIPDIHIVGIGARDQKCRADLPVKLCVGKRKDQHIRVRKGAEARKICGEQQVGVIDNAVKRRFGL